MSASCGHWAGSALVHKPCTLPVGQQPLGKQPLGRSSAKHLPFTDTLKVTDELASLFRA